MFVDGRRRRREEDGGPLEQRECGGGVSRRSGMSARTLRCERSRSPLGWRTVLTEPDRRSPRKHKPDRQREV